MNRNLIYAGMGALLGLVLIGIITLPSPSTSRG
jgi:hypothetical protein